MLPRPPIMGKKRYKQSMINRDLEVAAIKYFVIDSKRQGTCYHEFYKGKWDGITFWKKDSLSLHDDVLCECAGFAEAILAVIPSYGPFGITEISYSQWKEIGQMMEEKDQKAKELYQEADEWAKKVFETYDRFTILGI